MGSCLVAALMNFEEWMPNWCGSQRQKETNERKIMTKTEEIDTRAVFGVTHDRYTGTRYVAEDPLEVVLVSRATDDLEVWRVDPSRGELVLDRTLYRFDRTLQQGRKGIPKRTFVFLIAGGVAAVIGGWPLLIHPVWVVIDALWQAGLLGVGIYWMTLGAHHAQYRTRHVTHQVPAWVLRVGEVGVALLLMPLVLSLPRAQVAW